ncbi:MAG: CvpA family protein [Candidatus Competibacteraceae bacterium]|jgi:membrane protein required for colicin V production|nr:CvpA family protein [Candidatus Competibacteraceae bacterium]MBK7983541.1 CvpA family protein [Candidatus Competibacteraceae bacterium]MBK8897919.1 CvpA family protein [Candidatus Competibacteraceae bacterium]MBK8961722.1 CvpA family protein [Candidatus Competibacteraceae bacterium]MBK9950941.1 CvpA family protein [Candidatus Competibacteraceae bacterium]
MNWADYLIVIIVALSMLIGLWRGLLREVISLATWIAAFAIAFLFSADGAALLTPYIDIPPLRVAAAFGGLFLATLLLGGLLGILASYLVDYTGLNGTDRLLGMLFGFGRGAAVIVLLVLAAGVTPLPRDAWWQQAHLLGHFQNSALWLRGFLPPEIAQYVRFN